MTITVGPIIGHTTATSVKIWMRGKEGPQHASREYCYGAVDLYEGPVHVASCYCNLKDYYDFTGAVTFGNLKPKTKYTFRCATRYFADAEAPGVGRPSGLPLTEGADAVTGEFTTDGAESDGRLQLAFGSCRYLYWDNPLHNDAEKGDKTFASMLSLHQRNPLDFVLMLGDQVYADPLNALHQYEKLEDLYGIYQESFSQPHIRNLMSRVPTYMILDDHEIQNDWSKDRMRNGNQGFYTHAMHAYTSYQHLHNPDTPDGQYWYAFRKGAFPFFVMDTRTQRNTEGAGIEPRTILGREQLNAFLEWLHQNRAAPIKFVASSVPFFPDQKNDEDKWSGYPEERGLILEFLRLEKIRNVVFLSGDVHNSSFSRMSCYQDRQFGLTSLVASPFYWPYPHKSASDFYGGRTLEFMQWADPGRRIRDRIEYRYEGEGFVADESFVVVSIDLEQPDSLGRSGRARIFDRKGNPAEGYPQDFPF